LNVRRHSRNVDEYDCRKRAKNLSFKVRMKTFRDLAKKVVSDKATQRKYLQLADEIENCGQTRNKLAHGLWEFNRRHPGRLLNISRSKVSSFDVKRIAQFAETVGTLSFTLVYPRGERDVKVDHTYISRGFLLRTGKTTPPRISIDDIG
jgi:hypothetical protein